MTDKQFAWDSDNVRERLGSDVQVHAGYIIRCILDDLGQEPSMMDDDMHDEGFSDDEITTAKKLAYDKIKSLLEN